MPWDEGIGRKGLHGIPNVSRSESASPSREGVGLGYLE